MGGRTKIFLFGQSTYLYFYSTFLFVDRFRYWGNFRISPIPFFYEGLSGCYFIPPWLWDCHLIWNAVEGRRWAEDPWCSPPPGPSSPSTSSPSSLFTLIHHSFFDPALFPPFFFSLIGSFSLLHLKERLQGVSHKSSHCRKVLNYWAPHSQNVSGNVSNLQLLSRVATLLTVL